MLLLSSYQRIFRIAVFAVLVVITACTNGDHPPPAPLPSSGEKDSVMDGTLLRFEGNETGDVDRLVLQSKGGEQIIYFPPHTAQSIMDIAKPSSPIYVTITAHRQGQELVSITAGDQSLSIHDLPPPPPRQGQAFTVEGKASGIELGRNGRIRSFIIGNTLVALPPHIDMSDTASLRQAKSVTVKGFERLSGRGFVNLRASGIMRPTTIIINGITYTIE